VHIPDPEGIELALFQAEDAGYEKILHGNTRKFPFLEVCEN
jgi:hypothetical protein